MQEDTDTETVRSSDAITEEAILLMGEQDDMRLNADELEVISKHKTLATIFPTNGKIFIDRGQEDRDVEMFQVTGDMNLLEKVYVNRIPTIRTWAAKHYYPGLTNSIEDLFEELSVVFVKAAQKYNRKRGAFNTCIFTFFENRIKNIKSSMHAKKRISDVYDGPLNAMVLSLDYSYSETDGSDVTLKDIIPSNDNAEKNANFEEMVGVLSGGNPVIKDFLYKVGSGESVSTLLKEAKMKTGHVELDSNSIKHLGKRKNKSFAKKLLKNHIGLQNDFSLIDYSLEGATMKYSVEVKKTKEFELISKAIRNFKKNRTSLVSKIKGN